MPFYGTTLRDISVGLFAGSAFIAKLDPDGEGIWAKPIGGIGPASGTSFEGMYPSYCAVDSAGNPYIGGNFTGGTLIFDATDRSTALPGGGQWIAKYGAADGAVLWTKRPGRGGFTRDLSSDRAGNLYLTGSCALGAIYGNDTVRSGLDPRLPNLFVLSVDPQGGQRWLRTAGDLAGCVGLGIDVYHPDEPVVAGTISGGPSVDFGTSTCYNTGSSNGFVAKLRPVKTAVAGMNTAEFSIYPNPAQSELNLEQPAAGAFSHYRLLNALGQRVASGGLRPEQRQRISLPALTAGIYYLELSGAGGIARRAVSIQP